MIYLCPPAWQHEVGINIFISKLLGHIESQRSILVIYVSLWHVSKYRVGVVDFFKLVSSSWIIWILVWMVFQGQFSFKIKKKWGKVSSDKNCSDILGGALFVHRFYMQLLWSDKFHKNVGVTKQVLIRCCLLFLMCRPSSSSVVSLLMSSEEFSTAA